MPSNLITKGNEVFRVDGQIGKGAFGRVYKITNSRTSRQFVLKVVPFEFCDPAARKTVKGEVDILKLGATKDHPNIVKYYDSWFRDSTLCILMEYVPNGTLETRILAKRAEKGHFVESEVKHMLEQLLSALRCCHDELNVIHRDIKAGNVLVDRYGTLKLADFGISKQVDVYAQCAATQAGTPLYMPPEMLEGHTSTSKVDGRMLGCL